MGEIRASDYFAIVPEYVLYAPVSSNAVRLFAILHRYANTNLRAWPSRKTLAEAMNVSTATVDRAKDELVDLGAVIIEHRTTDLGDPTSNLYILRMTPDAPTSSDVMKGTRTHEERGTRRRDALNRANVNQRQVADSSTMKRYVSQASHVASLARMGRHDDIEAYIEDQDEAARDYLWSVAQRDAR